MFRRVLFRSALLRKLDKTGGDVSGNINLTNNSTIQGIPDPQDDYDAISKTFLETQLQSLNAVTTNTPNQHITVAKIFDVPPFISGDPSSSSHAVNKGFLDSEIANKIPYYVLNCRPRFKDQATSLFILQNSLGASLTFSKIALSTGEFKLYSTTPIFTLASNGTSYISVFLTPLFLQTPYAANYFFKIFHYSAYELRLYVYNSSGQLTDDSFDYLSLLIHMYPDGSV